MAASERESTYGSMETQSIPHPARFPGQDTPACVLPLANGRHVQMTLADEEDTDMEEYTSDIRAYSEF